MEVSWNIDRIIDNKTGKLNWLMNYYRKLNCESTDTEQISTV
jgi:hypothetical protein